MEKRLEAIFSSVPDPRVSGRCLHNLIDILMISLCTMIADGEYFEDMVEFGVQKEGFLRRFLETVLKPICHYFYHSNIAHRLAI